MISDINTSVGADRVQRQTRVGYLRCLLLLCFNCKVILPFFENFRVKIEIPRLMANSAATSARNSATRGKLWALQITDMKPSASISVEFCIQNALKFAYVHLKIQKFPRVCISGPCTPL
jgi:hypothetical protein